MEAQTETTLDLELDLFARTDLGGRPNNEDAFIVCDLSTGNGALPRGAQRARVAEPGYLIMVSDGMGGAEGGEVASGSATKGVRDYLLAHRSELTAPATPGERPPQEVVLEQAFIEVNKALRQLSEERQLKGMGATATAILISGRNCHFAHVGDSRLYRVAEGKIEQLSQDHSLVAELVRLGKITPQQARTHPKRSLITQSLGALPTIQAQTHTFPLATDDLLVLCSDGLTSVVDDTKLLHTTLEAGNARAICHELVKVAKEERTDDNVTVSVCIVHRVSPDRGATVTATRNQSAAPPAARPTTPALKAKRLVWVLAGLVGFGLGVVVGGRPRFTPRPYVVNLDRGKGVIREDRRGWFGRHRVRTLSETQTDLKEVTPDAPRPRGGVAFGDKAAAQTYLKSFGKTGPKKAETATPKAGVSTPAGKPPKAPTAASAPAPTRSATSVGKKKPSRGVQ